MAAVIGVVGGSGGVGASTFAAVLAAVAQPSVLVDLDVCGGGIDVGLGLESVPGARWSGLHVAGGRLDPGVLLGGLPRWGRCAVLAADVAELEPTAVRQVLGSAVSATGLDAVVVDLPRHDCAERAAALLRCDLVVVVVRADVAGVVGAHAVVRALPELPLGLVVRRGALPAEQAAELVGARLLGTLPAVRRAPFAVDGVHPPRAAARVATGILAGARTRSTGVSRAPLAVAG